MEEVGWTSGGLSWPKCGLILPRLSVSGLIWSYCSPKSPGLHFSHLGRQNQKIAKNTKKRALEQADEGVGWLDDTGRRNWAEKWLFLVYPPKPGF